MLVHVHTCGVISCDRWWGFSSKLKITIGGENISEISKKERHMRPVESAKSDARVCVGMRSSIVKKVNS